VKQTDIRDVFKKATKGVCIVVPSDPLFPAPSTSSPMNTPENTERILMTLNQQLKELSHWNTPLISVAAQL